MRRNKREKSNKKERATLNKKATKTDTGGKVIKINVGFTVVKVVAILVLVSFIATEAILTIIGTKQETAEASNDSTCTWVESTEIDEDTGEYIQVPVPNGYTASEIEGETGVSTGFVIYENNYNGEEINWDEIIVDSDANDESDEENLSSTSNTSEDGTSTASIKAETTTASAEQGVEASDENTESADNTENTTTEENTTGNETENTQADETNNAIENNTDTAEGSAVEGDTNTSNETAVASEDEEDDTVTYTVTVYYLDADTLEEIAETVTTEYSEGDTYETEQIEIEGYTYSYVDGEETGTVTEDVIVTYYYEAEETYYLSEYYSEETASNIWDLQESVNQWVWIPVSEEEIDTIYGIDENGKYWGKLYSNYSTKQNWTETNGVMSITSKTSYREPDIVNDYATYDVDSKLTSYLNGMTEYELLEELEENFYETIQSIKTYGGFYIGRYETGDLSKTTACVRKNNTIINTQTWYVMYEKCEDLNGENADIRTSMINGCLWDYTLRWFIDTEATINDGTTMTTSMIWTDSTDWGNYYAEEFEYYTSYNEVSTKTGSTTTLVPTGNAERSKVNNIYDMAGNEAERTLEAYSTNCRVTRSASVFHTGSSGGFAGRQLLHLPDGFGLEYSGAVLHFL